MLNVEPGRFLILGHRGASAHARENTLEAFALAAEQGADGVELDVRRTADDALVVHHDAVLADAGPIVAMTLAELKEVAPHVPTLPEAMKACRGLIVNVEIKNWVADPDFDPHERVARATAAWLDTHGWESHAVASSFNPQTIDDVRSGWPRLATAQLLGRAMVPIEELAEVARRGHQGVHPNYESITDVADLVSAARAHDLWVIPWTVDDPGVIRDLAESGATGVFTNDPAAAREALAG